MGDDGPDFRTLFEATPGPYLVLDPDLRIVAVNEAYLRATLTTREGLVGRGIFQAFPDNPDDPSATGVANLRASLERVLRERVPDAMAVQKYDIPRSEGGFEERWWSPVNSPVSDPDGALRYVIHRVEDVTEFVRLRRAGHEQEQVTAALRTRAEQVEAEVYLRAQEVQQANARLRAANEEMTRLNRRLHEQDQLKTQFFANVSHELRTPLALILGPLERWLGAGSVAPELRHDLEVMGRNARLLLKHVNDLLDVAKLEAGQMTPRFAETDLAALVRLVAGHFDSLAQERQQTYEVEVPQALAAQVDPEKVERVLLNLLSNAFKFTPEGGRVRVTLAAGPDPQLARLVVADSGPGVSPGLRQAVFERFRQGDGGSTRRVGGTGLGLAIARDFVLLHGGAIELGESPWGGAEVRVTLPLRAPAGCEVRQAAPEPAPEHARQHVDELRLRRAAAPPAVGGTRGRVLVIEDNPDMAEFIARALSGEYQVEVAHDGAQGLTSALQRRPDVVLTDMMMPRLSGAGVLAELRRRRELDLVAVVVLTANADDALRVKLLRDGAQDCLVKPFRLEELRARIGNLVALKRTRELLQRESDGQLHDLEALAREVAARKRELEHALALAEVARREAEVAAGEKAAALAALLEREEQLRQANKLEAVGRLAGGIAHDFNNLLTAIEGYSELTLEWLPAGDRSRAAVEQISKAGRRAAALTRQLLAFSRKQLLQPRVIDLNAIVRDMSAMLQRLIGEDIELITVCAHDLFRVKADPSQLEQVIVNLVVNARDAMPQGGKLTVETLNVELDQDYARSHSEVVPGPHVLLAVTDTGSGMSKETLGRVFEPFFTTKGERGTGLGLATVYGVVKQSQGHVWVYSEPGRGTTFKVYLPRCADEADDSVAPAAAASQPPQGSETVLLVEDEPEVRELARTVLEMNGYSVLVAESGPAALELAQGHAAPIHLLLTDVVLPSMNGRQLFQALQVLRPELRVLYMSGYTDNAIVHHGVLEPGTPFIQKPFSLRELAARLRQVLDDAREGGAPPGRAPGG